MPELLFTNLWMLAGLGALAAPVIIHLLLRRKKKRLRFSTVQFFVKQDEQSSRRRKIRNWLLLALRLLIFSLLVLAFARPFLRQSEASAGARASRQFIFVVDRSASMFANGPAGPKWPEAKSQMQRFLAELQQNDRAALIGCATQTELLSGFSPPSVVAKRIDELQLTYGSSSIAEGLRLAIRLVQGGDPNLDSTICVVSDLQRTACRDLASAPLPQSVAIQVVTAGDLFPPNLAIDRLHIDPQFGAKPQLAIANYSLDDLADAALDFTIDGNSSDSRTISLAAGASTNLEIFLPPLQPGWHDLHATLRMSDAMEIDNSRHATLFAPEPSRVLVVETRTTTRVFEEESFFVATALDPTKGSTNSIPTPFTVSKLPVDQLPDKLANIQTSPPCELVILPGLRDVPPRSGVALTAFAHAGGGVLLFLGDGVSANRYNTEFRDLLPAELGTIDTSLEPRSEWRIGPVDTNDMAFAAFGAPNSGDLRIPKFTKRFLLSAGTENRVPARFDDGLPLLLVRSVGRGRVALVNSSADTSWHDWPKHKTFVPWLHGLAKHLAAKSDQHLAHAIHSFLAGDELEIDAGSAARNSQFKLIRPDGRESLLTADEHGLVRDSQRAVPGTYSLRDQVGHELRRLSANIPSQESDLTALPASEFLQQLVRTRADPEASSAAELLGASHNQKELWRVLLLGALALLLVEVFVANRSFA